MQQLDLNTTDFNYAITPSRASSMSHTIPAYNYQRAAVSTWGEPERPSIDACTSPTKPVSINSTVEPAAVLTSPTTGSHHTPFTPASNYNNNPYLREEERREKNKRSVLRLISNNTTALTLFIPQWDHSNNFDESNTNPGESSDQEQNLFNIHQLTHPPDTTPLPDFWELDESIGRSPGMASRWKMIKAKFKRTLKAIHALDKMYSVPAFKQTLFSANQGGSADLMDIGSSQHTHNHNLDPRRSSSAPPMVMVNESDESIITPDIVKHAIVLSHIAARRTDDPKVGVGELEKESN